MRDIVLVPCYERLEYTRLCLEYLSRARGITKKIVCLCPDDHIGDGGIWKDQMVNVNYGEKLFGLNFWYLTKCPHNMYGNSANIINALQFAYETGAERIFLVEDDIMVAPDIFEWHEAILEDAHCFVSCATALNKSAHFQINGPQAMDERCQDPAAYKLVPGAYSSHAVAFTRKNLGVLLDDLKGYTWRPGMEQDLLTQQFMRTCFDHTYTALDRMVSAWPYVPRAFNCGMRSYHINTGGQFNGTLEEKVRALDVVIHDPVRLREMSANNAAVTALPEKWPVRTEPVRNVQSSR